MAISAMIFKYTPAHVRSIFDINKSKSKHRNSCKNLVCTCEKAFLDNVGDAGHQPGKERSYRIANFHKALQDNCSHTKNYLSKWVFKISFV